NGLDEIASCGGGVRRGEEPLRVGLGDGTHDGCFRRAGRGASSFFFRLCLRLGTPAAPELRNDLIQQPQARAADENPEEHSRGVPDPQRYLQGRGGRRGWWL